MAHVFEFMLVDSGDSSVGIQSFQSKVTIIVHEPDLPEDFEERCRSFLADEYDCACAPLKQFTKDELKDQWCEGYNAGKLTTAPPNHRS